MRVRDGGDGRQGGTKGDKKQDKISRNRIRDRMMRRSEASRKVGKMVMVMGMVVMVMGMIRVLW